MIGFVWRDGPCSAYAVQRTFAVISAGWSSSPGSIYPLIARLEKAGFVQSIERKWGNRKKRVFETTELGRARLADWVQQVPSWTGRPAADPIRSRSFFLECICDKHQQLAFIDEAEIVTQAALDRLELGLSTVTNQSMEWIAQRGGVYHLKARLAWLAEARKAITQREDRSSSRADFANPDSLRSA